MASGGKKRTTMAKLNRETRLRTKRAEKAARRAARKLTASDATEAASDRDAFAPPPTDDEHASRPT